MKRDKQYIAYLNSKAWKAKKKLMFGKFGKSCQACRNTKKIDVHHLHYRNFGDELLQDLMVLCRKCHSDVHKLASKHRYTIEYATSVIYYERQEEPSQKRERRG